MAEYDKLMARIPIVPDDFTNHDDHITHELVMDYNELDIYIKKADGTYDNITGKIKQEIKEIQDGSCVFHIVTEASLPPVSDRKKNHWYYVITATEEIGGEEEVSTTSYVYYGLVNNYSPDKNYLLVGQNAASSDTTVRITVDEDHSICFYVPTTYAPSFKDVTTGARITYDVVDTLYAVNTVTGSYITYDVYILNYTRLGEAIIQVTLSGTNLIHIDFDFHGTQIVGITLPESRSIIDGEEIGTLEDPIITQPAARYKFDGYSSSNQSFQPITSSYIPDEDMTVYAWFTYDSDPGRYEYYANYKSVNASVPQLGIFCSTALPGTTIYPKSFTGYTSPIGGESLTQDKQTINFLYTPISYDITYSLGGGTISGERNSYTIEDDYTPPTPVKPNYTFVKWTPSKINLGSTGNVQFVATWEADSVTLTGAQLNAAFDNIGQTVGISGSFKGIITAITKATELPPSTIEPINICSIDGYSILAWWSQSTSSVMIYSEKTIICNPNMSGAFAGMTSLISIPSLAEWNCKAGTDISYLFNGCTLLSDVSDVDDWGGSAHTFSNFAHAFDGTAALTAQRVPTWYRCLNNITYVSTTGTTLETRTGVSNIPGTSINAKSFTGYTINEPSSYIVEIGVNYTFTYTPISYSITYELHGGTIVGALSTYTIETPTYTPPTPTLSGCIFIGWNGASSIPQGSTGDVNFEAVWALNPTMQFSLMSNNATGLTGQMFYEWLRSDYYTLFHNTTELTITCESPTGYVYCKSTEETEKIQVYDISTSLPVIGSTVILNGGTYGQQQNNE